MRIVLVLGCVAVVGPALAEEQPVALVPGPGLATVGEKCSGCHSMDYIVMNSPFLTADGWKAEVTKMRAAYGAPIEDADAATIQGYLAGAYGAKP
jgi:mono/diheme cytochrome c family protein